MTPPRDDSPVLQRQSPLSQPAAPSSRDAARVRPHESATRAIKTRRHEQQPHHDHYAPHRAVAHVRVGRNHPAGRVLDRGFADGLVVLAPDPEKVPLFGFTVLFPVTFLSAVFVPIDTMPGWSQPSSPPAVGSRPAPPRLSLLSSSACDQRAGELWRAHRNWARAARQTSDRSIPAVEGATAWRRSWAGRQVQDLRHGSAACRSCFGRPPSALR